MSETVKLIVTLTKGQYEALEDMKFGSIASRMIFNAVKHGTPLPKGHGRLGDLDALEELCTTHAIGNNAFDSNPIIEQGYYSDGDCIWKPLFDFAPTIIEADKED